MLVYPFLCFMKVDIHKHAYESDRRDLETLTVNNIKFLDSLCIKKIALVTKF